MPQQQVNADEVLAELRGRFTKLTPEMLSTLKNAAEFRTIWGTLRRFGQVNIVLGGIYIALAIFGLGFDIMSVLELLFGVFLLVQSAWSITRPSVTGILMLSIVFLLVGVYNVFFTVQSGFRGIGLFFGFLGVLQLTWAFQYYNRYKRYSAMSLTEPSEQVAAFVASVWNAIEKLRPSPTNDVIEFIARARRWRGLLLETAGVFAENAENSIVFASKPELNFEIKNMEAWTNGHRTATVTLEHTTTTGTIDRESFNKWIHWKSV
jgi:hypothetical protein